jgi:hypothetical protein
MERLAQEKSIPTFTGFHWQMTEQDFLCRWNLDMEKLATSIPQTGGGGILQQYVFKQVYGVGSLHVRFALIISTITIVSSPSLKPCGAVRLLILHGTGDRTIPFKESELCASLVKNCELCLIKGADHNFTKPEHAEQLARKVVEFVTSK